MKNFTYKQSVTLFFIAELYKLSVHESTINM